MSDKSSCCCSSSGCCESAETEKKKIDIDFLYLDLTVCTRCQGAESNLEAAIGEVSGVLEAAGFDVAVNKVNITSKELAEQYKFLSSPTIRVNGRDIALELAESTCEECGDLCGDSVDCRVWVHEGVEYTEPPKAMIINSILKEVYGESVSSKADEEYVLPDNLKNFFEKLESK